MIPMKIAQVISTPPFAWATGGCARVAFDLSKALVDRGHDVTILTTDLYEPGQRYPQCHRIECIDGIKIIRFENISDNLAWNHKLYISPKLIMYLKNHSRDYDLIHLQDLLSLHALVTSYYCAMYNIPYILTTHGSLPWLHKQRLFNKIGRRLFNNLVLKNASKILVLNRTEARLCKDLGVHHIEIVPNGVSHCILNVESKNINFREKYLINKLDKIVLYIGRIHKTKGIDLLIMSLSRLVKKLGNIKLVIIGPDDGHKPKLESLINSLKLENKIIFTGFVSDEEKIGALMEADVFVTPSFSGFPIAFLEACSCGVPIITTNRGDQLEWINKYAGFVVNYDDRELCEAILILLTDEKLNTQIRNNCRKLANETFSWDGISKKIERMYEEVIQLQQGG